MTDIRRDAAQIARVLGRLGMVEERALVERHLVAHATLPTIVVVGETQRGKSSLVNALLGGDFSPVAPTGSVGIRVVLEHAETPTATVELASGDRRCCSPHVVLSVLEAARATSGPAGSPCSITLGSPAPLLTKATLIDTAGFGVGSRPNLAEVMTDVHRATITLVVLSATAPVSRAELEAIRAVARASVRVAFVMTKADRSLDPAGRLDDARRVAALDIAEAGEAPWFLVATPRARRAQIGERAFGLRQLESSGLPAVAAFLGDELDRNCVEHADLRWSVTRRALLEQARVIVDRRLATADSARRERDRCATAAALLEADDDAVSRNVGVLPAGCRSVADEVVERVHRDLVALVENELHTAGSEGLSLGDMERRSAQLVTAAMLDLERRALATCVRTLGSAVTDDLDFQRVVVEVATAHPRAHPQPSDVRWRLGDERGFSGSASVLDLAASLGEAAQSFGLLSGIPLIGPGIALLAAVSSAFALWQSTGDRSDADRSGIARATCEAVCESFRRSAHDRVDEIVVVVSRAVDLWIDRRRAGRAGAARSARAGRSAVDDTSELRSIDEELRRMSAPDPAVQSTTVLLARGADLPSCGSSTAG